MIKLILLLIRRDKRTPPPKEPPSGKAFRVRDFCLGKDVAVDRDRIYRERGV